MHCEGYLVKAGYVAVIAEAVTIGKIPAGQMDCGKGWRRRFVNIYFAVDRPERSARNQKMGSALSGMRARRCNLRQL